MSFYPRILYKPGTQWTVEGGGVDLRAVGSEAEEKQAIADGWRESADDALNSAAFVVANIEGESVEEVREFARQKAVQVGMIAPSRADMLTALEAAGIDVDGRWGDKRIAAEYAKLKGA